MIRKLLFILLAFVLISPLALAQKQLLDRVVAVVNDEIITQSELDYLLRPVYQDFKQAFSGEELMQRLNEARRKLLTQLIEDRLVFQKAEEEGIVVSEGEITEQMRKFREQFPTEMELEQAMEREGFTLSKMKERLRRQAMIRELHGREVRAHVAVSPKEIQDYYNENSTDFESDEQIKIRSITVKKSDEARRKGLKDEYAEDKIGRLLNRINNGQAFAKVASEYSEDTRAKEGGVSDWIQKGSMIPVIDEVIFKLEKDEISDIVETSMGYHLFLLEDKKKGYKKTFEEVREQIHSHIFGIKAQARFNEWMKGLKKEAYISIR